jgi:hypothetical protein
MKNYIQPKETKRTIQNATKLLILLKKLDDVKHKNYKK